VVLTAAMRPATSLQADGPQNLLDAVTVAGTPDASGVLVVLAGQVWAGAEVRKVHSYRTEAFATAGPGPLGLVVEGQFQPFRHWPGNGRSGQGVEPGLPRVDDESTVTAPGALALNQPLPEAADAWPWVEIVSSHAGASPRAVQALLSAGVQGLVVACTGNGSVHRDLEAALLQAVSEGVPVLRATRCMAGGIVPGGHGALPSAGQLTPAQARVELTLRLLPWRAQAA
jgi:L-asparaginase